MEYNKKLDPFNEENWNEEDIPQKEEKIWSIDVPYRATQHIDDRTIIYVRSYLGKYHFFTIEGSSWILINDIIDYVDGFCNPFNNEVVGFLIRPNTSERKGLNRGKIKIGNFNVKELRNHFNSNRYRFKIKI